MWKWYNMYAILDQKSLPNLHSSTYLYIQPMLGSTHPPTSPHIIRKQPVWTKVDQWEKEDKKQNCKSVLALYPNIHILDSCPIIFITISYLREFDKRSLKHFPSGDHLISFHNLSPPLSNEIVWRKFKLVISGLNGLKWKLCICTPKHFITTYL